MTSPGETKFGRGNPIVTGIACPGSEDSMSDTRDSGREGPVQEINILEI